MNTIEELYKEYQPRLAAYSYKILKNNENAKDCVQEVFKRLAKQDMGKIKDHIHQWLFVVCRNCSLKILKRQNFVLLDENHDQVFSEDKNPFESLDSKEKIKKLLWMVEQLPKKRKDILKLRFVHDLKYEEIAKKLKTTSGNVGFMLSTTLCDLREKFSKTIDK